jgi:ornithine--oxo-acid transaminase
MPTESIALADRHGAHNYHPLPVEVATAEGCWMVDTDGKRYLDMLSSYSALNQGHRHPRILAAAHAQMARVTLTSRAFHNDRLGPFLATLARVSGFSRALPMNSGAEACETAIKAMRRWGYRVKGVPDGRAEIIVARDNFHGRTTTLVSFSTEPEYRDGFGPFTPGFVIVPYGDADALAAAITPNTVGVFLEPIQGEAGVVVPPDDYLARVRAACDAERVLLVIDEIQTGLGRTGRMWCFEHAGIRPDGITIGKALGGGLAPVSAFCADDAVMDVFTPGSHGSTFGGNPLAAAIAQASLEVIVDERLPERAAEMGAVLREGLAAIASARVREIRGKGLLVGVELHAAAGPARPYCERLMERGVLCKDTHGQVIRFAPPLVIGRDDIDFALAHVAEVLA